MKTHTSGPWEIDYGDYCVYSKSSDGSSYVMVASVQASGSNRQNPDWGEDEANLALIAAAPELLEALQGAERALRWAAQRSAGRVNRETVGGWLYEADRALAVIEKAKRGPE